MKEEFLHYLWKNGLYDHDSLIDDSGKRIVVLNPGKYNRDSGPD
jgi:nitric oxide reductase activation protein